MKQALTETLAYFDANEQAFRMSDLKTYVDAARLVERLLPGECEMCDGMGTRSGYHASGPIEDWTCEFCHGTGQVWDEGIVEAVSKEFASALQAYRLDLTAGALVELCDAHARAVLSALAQPFPPAGR